MATTDPRVNWRYVDSMLESWGCWIENHASWTSYPSRSAIAGVINEPDQTDWFRVKQLTASGNGGAIFGGHRILCYDMPEWIRGINLIVIRLPDEQYDAVLARYALGLRDDGLRFSRDDQARALSITVDAFDQRLKRARRRFAEIFANATGKRQTVGTVRFLSPNPA